MAAADPCSDLHELDVVFERDAEAKNQQPRYAVYVMDISYFSGKLETYLRFKRISFTRIEVTHKQFMTLFQHTGLVQVPILLDRSTGKYYRDTTSIIELFESRPAEFLEPSSARRPVMPSNPEANFISQLLEDYFDEWMWTPALYYRWEPRLDAGNLARRFIKHDFMRDMLVPMPDPVAELVVIDRQHEEYVRAGGGVRDAAGKAMMEDIYKATLARLNAHFQQSPFVMGAQPSFADFGLMASMFRHFALDPTPAKIMRLTAPAVYEWVARMWNASCLEVSDQLDTPLPDGVEPLVRDALKHYIPYLIANARAVIAGESEVIVGPLRMKPVAFRAWSASRLVRAWEALDEHSKASLDSYCRGLGHNIHSLIDEGPLLAKAGAMWEAGAVVAPPHCVPHKPASFLQGMLGTPNHQARLSLQLTPLTGGLLKLLAVILVSTRLNLVNKSTWLWSFASI
ncbi:Hypothetical protein SCF082_LOCUS19172, partial [Durusdinium trenchii]